MQFQRMIPKSILTAAFLAGCLATHLAAFSAGIPQWSQFRGPQGNGIATDQSIDFELGREEHVRWKTALPPGHSSPCIWDDRIFVTATEDTAVKMLCLRRSDGVILWQRERGIPKPKAYEHIAGSPANSTPTTDGQRVVFFFDDYGVVVLDFEGALVWEKPLPPTNNRYSYGASPVLDQNRIYLNRDGGPEPGLLCLSATDGTELWKADRPNTIVSFCTPYLVGQGAEKLVLAGGTGTLTAYEAQTGRTVWEAAGFPIFICPSPVVSENTVVFGGWTTAHVGGRARVESGFDENSGVSAEALENPEAFFAQFDANKDGVLTVEELPPSRARDAFNFIDRDHNGRLEISEWAAGYDDKPMVPGRNVVRAIRLGGKGNVSESHVAWELTRGLPYVASPLVYRGCVYLVATGGFITCVDAESGQPHFLKKRLGVAGEYYASPVAVGEHILVCAHRGSVFLVQAGEQFEIVQRADLGEAIFATPAIADNTLYLRTDEHLWAIGEGAGRDVRSLDSRGALRRDPGR